MCENVQEFTLELDCDIGCFTLGFQVWNDESVLFHEPAGGLTERLEQVSSGWSFQKDLANVAWAEFMEEVDGLDLLEWSDGMELNQVVVIRDGLTLVREG